MLIIVYKSYKGEENHYITRKTTDQPCFGYGTKPILH